MSYTVEPSVEHELLKHRDIELNLCNFTLYGKTKKIELNKHQMKLLLLFLFNVGCKIPRKDIIYHIWGNKKLDVKSINRLTTRIDTLRREIKKVSNIKYIHANRKGRLITGYSFF